LLSSRGPDSALAGAAPAFAAGRAGVTGSNDGVAAYGAGGANMASTSGAGSAVGVGNVVYQCQGWALVCLTK